MQRLYSAMRVVGVIALIAFVVSWVLFSFHRCQFHWEQEDNLNSSPKNSSEKQQNQVTKPGEVLTESECKELFGNSPDFSLNFKFPVVSLASFPRSGNTMTRLLLQRATGKCTGSIYSDPGLQRIGLCERIIFGAAVVKTHLLTTIIQSFEVDQAAMMGCSIPNAPRYTATKTILLVRNPFDCLLSYYHYTVMWKTELTANKTRREESEIKWPEFVSTFSLKWGEYIDHWLRRSTVPVLFLRYEDIKEDTANVLHKILQFLNISLQSIDPKRMQCAITLSKCKKEDMCRKGEIGRGVMAFSLEEREMVLSRLTPFMVKFNYSTDVMTIPMRWEE